MTTWTAPDVERRHELYVGDERAMLQSWLDYHRDTLLWKCRGLTAEQLKVASVPSSTLTLLGLVRHLTDVERWWFRIRAAGLDLEAIYCTDDNPDGDFDDAPTADAEAAFAAFWTEVAAADQAVAAIPLDQTFWNANRETDLSVRWVYTHMIEEYARHNGHADLLREGIDGVTGD